MALADLDERSDRWELPRLPGRRIDRIVIGSMVGLHFDYEPGEEPNNDRPWSIGIEQPFEVVSASGEVAPADFESTPRKLAPVLDLLWQPVESATVWLDGRLAVVFENGMRL